MPTSVDELASLVATARQATKDLDGSSLQQIAFERVLVHLLANSAAPASTAPSHREPATTAVAAQGADGVLADEQQRLDALAHYFKILPEQVLHIFEVTEAQPKLTIHTKHLSESKSEATRDIALLVAGALTALGQQTTTSLIREVTDNYGKLDDSNFMKTLTDQHEISVLGKPRSSNRIIRMRVTGAEAAQALVRRIIGE